MLPRDPLLVRGAFLEEAGLGVGRALAGWGPLDWRRLLTPHKHPLGREGSQMGGRPRQGQGVMLPLSAAQPGASPKAHWKRVPALTLSHAPTAPSAGPAGR